jgi:hypothetical protein
MTSADFFTVTTLWQRHGYSIGHHHLFSEAAAWRLALEAANNNYSSLKYIFLASCVIMTKVASVDITTRASWQCLNNPIIVVARGDWR